MENNLTNEAFPNPRVSEGCSLQNPFPADNHPCFNRAVRHRTGRIHLPVAGKCTIQCGFCNRKYDCVNESRPGVTSAVLTPEAALDYLERALQKIPNIAVAGIAGPGDPFTEPEITLQTLRLVAARYPGLLLCIATNGLNLTPYAGELAALHVSHVTVTVNAVNPIIGMKIYEWVQDGTRVLQGINGARFLFEQQESAVKALKAAGITVKINTVVVPGINDRHTKEVAVWAAGAGADIHNFIPVIPVAGTLFADVVPPSPAQMAEIRRTAGEYLPQMAHCGRCRADAAGLLGVDNTAILDELRQKARADSKPDTPKGAVSTQKPYIAVATQDGLSINRHLGRADVFYIYGQGIGQGEETGKNTPVLIEIRESPAANSENRWKALADTLHDCFAVLAAASGAPPKQALAAMGITVYDREGAIADHARALFGEQARPAGIAETASVPERDFHCSRAGSCHSCPERI